MSSGKSILENKSGVFLPATQQRGYESQRTPLPILASPFPRGREQRGRSKRKMRCYMEVNVAKGNYGVVREIMA